jgi:hypothetical protein
MLLAMLALTMQGPVSPAPLHYRIESSTSSAQDLTSMGRGKVSGGLSTTGYVTVTMSDSADGVVARVTVDSMQLTPIGAMTAQITPATAALAADSARGAWVDVYAVHGVIRGTPRPSSQNPALAAVMQAVGVLYPGLRNNVKVGDAWADTTNVDSDVQSGHQKGEIIATWKAAGVDGGNLVLDGTAATRMTTTGTNGQVVKVSLNSVEHLVEGARGAPTRMATIESSSDVTMTTPQSSTPIPATNSGSLKLTLLP